MIPDPEHEPQPARRLDGRDASTVRGRVAPAALPQRSLREVLATLYEERRLVVAVAILVIAASVAYALLATPIYAGRLVVQVEDTRRTLVGLEAVPEIFSDKRPAETEIAIMRSQVILDPVVAQLRLDIEAAPRQSFVARLLRRDPGASIDVAELDVPESLVDKPLVVTALGGGRYRLRGPDGNVLLDGSLGARATRDLGPGPGGAVEAVRIVVSDLEGPVGAEFVVVRRDRAGTIQRLRDDLQIVESGKSTGILDVTLDGPDPKRVAATLNAFGSAYVRQNVERKSAEAEKTLQFLDAQLPELKANVDRTEAALEQFQTRKGTVSLSRRSESMLTQSVDVDKELSTLQLQRTELRQRFTEQHPQVAAIDRKIDQLRARRAGMEGSMRKLPADELELARLTRDQKVASQVYDVLLNKAQELRILRSGVVGNVRVLDHAPVPRRPARPRRLPVVLLGALVGGAAGIAAAFARRALDQGAEDPDEIEARTGLPVYVTIPHSATQQSLFARARDGAAITPLVTVDAGDPAVEGLRSLRTALQFALVDARNNVLSIGSPSPGVGKSFVSANLALLLAAAGNRVLLIDADLRRGRLHRYFSVARRPGLSDVLTGGAPIDAAIQRSDAPRSVDVLPTGKIPPNPAELLSSERFEQLLAGVSRRYDFVLVDTPPVLAVTDAVIVARSAGVNLLVLRAGQHPFREISAAVRQFAQNGCPLQGAILNDARSTRHGYGRYGRYYEYRSETQH